MPKGDNERKEGDGSKAATKTASEQFVELVQGFKANVEELRAAVRAMPQVPTKDEMSRFLEEKLPKIVKTALHVKARGAEALSVTLPEEVKGQLAELKELVATQKSRFEQLEALRQALVKADTLQADLKAFGERIAVLEKREQTEAQGLAADFRQVITQISNKALREVNILSEEVEHLGKRTKVLESREEKPKEARGSGVVEQIVKIENALGEAQKEFKRLGEIQQKFGQEIGDLKGLAEQIALFNERVFGNKEGKREDGFSCLKLVVQQSEEQIVALSDRVFGVKDGKRKDDAASLELALKRLADKVAKLELVAKPLADLPKQLFGEPGKNGKYDDGLSPDGVESLSLEVSNLSKEVSTLRADLWQDGRRPSEAVSSFDLRLIDIEKGTKNRMCWFEVIRTVLLIALIFAVCFLAYLNRAQIKGLGQPAEETRNGEAQEGAKTEPAEKPSAGAVMLAEEKKTVAPSEVQPAEEKKIENPASKPTEEKHAESLPVKSVPVEEKKPLASQPTQK